MEKIIIKLDDVEYKINPHFKNILVEFLHFLTYKTDKFFQIKDYLLVLLKAQGYDNFHTFAEAIKKAKIPRTDWGNMKGYIVKSWIRTELGCDKKDSELIIEHLLQIGALEESIYGGNYR